MAEFAATLRVVGCVAGCGLVGAGIAFAVLFHFRPDVQEVRDLLILAGAEAIIVAAGMAKVLKGIADRGQRGRPPCRSARLDFFSVRACDQHGRDLRQRNGLAERVSLQLVASHRSQGAPLLLYLRMPLLTVRSQFPSDYRTEDEILRAANYRKGA